MTEFKSKSNKWLRIADGVTLTDKIDGPIHALDKYFERAGLVRYVVSGYRLRSDQVRIIRNYAIDQLGGADYGEFDVEKKNPIGQYVWQYDWSRLLEKGYLIAPPMPATVLVHYMKDGVNRFGQLWEPSGHFGGGCFDISGSRGDQDADEAKSVDDELKVVKGAMAEEDLGLNPPTVERKNNALHLRAKDA